MAGFAFGSRRDFSGAVRVGAVSLMSALEGASWTGWSSDYLASFATIAARNVTLAGQNLPQNTWRNQRAKGLLFRTLARSG